MPLAIRFAHPGSQGTMLGIVLFLCVCVIVQMLGVPVTLLSPVLTLDTLGASVLEGFSVPSTSLRLDPSIEFLQVADIESPLYVSLLPSAFFHPPVL